MMNKYRSKDEQIFADELSKRNIDFEYESMQLTLLKGIKTAYSNYRDTTYTPDFTFTYNNIKYVIEIKGFLRGDNGLKNKLADIQLTKAGYVYYVLQYSGRVKDGTKGFYKYNNANKKNGAKNFFELVGIDA